MVSDVVAKQLEHHFNNQTYFTASQPTPTPFPDLCTTHTEGTTAGREGVAWHTWRTTTIPSSMNDLVPSANTRSDPPPTQLQLDVLLPKAVVWGGG